MMARRRRRRSRGGAGIRSRWLLEFHGPGNHGRLMPMAWLLPMLKPRLMPWPMPWPMSWPMPWPMPRFDAVADAAAAI